MFEKRFLKRGLNKIYSIEIRKMKMDDGRKGIAVTAGNFATGMTSVVISEEDWKKIKKAV